MIKIHNIRIGFETNSSSSHSFVILPEKRPTRIPDNVKTDYFGWEWRLIKHPEEIASYIITQAFEILSKHEFLSFLEKIDTSVNLSPDTGVDHQSRFEIKGDSYILTEFLADLYVAILCDPSVGIVTGNDNEFPPPNFENLEKHKGWSWLHECNWYVSRPGNYYLLLSNTPPIRQRISFFHKELKPKYPESIDIKITSCCEANCPYCHEDSSPPPKCKHCDFDVFRRVIWEISGKTLEVALGGGNPLLHPDFFKIFKLAHEYHVIANFTVRDSAWLNFLQTITEDQYKLLTKYDYGIGISVSDISTVRELILQSLKLREKFENRKDWYWYNIPFNYTFHLINRIHSFGFIKRLVKLLREFYYKPIILILGYKPIGRGKSYKNLKKDLNPKKLLKLDAIITFDDLAIQQLNLKRFIKPENWSKYYAGRDGEYTMYLDLVELKFASSSASEKRHDMNKFSTVRDMFNFVRKEVV